jgi:hypothetical protein
VFLALFLDCLALKNEKDKLFRNVGNNQSTMSNVPKERNLIYDVAEARNHARLRIPEARKLWAALGWNATGESR